MIISYCFLRLYERSTMQDLTLGPTPGDRKKLKRPLDGENLMGDPRAGLKRVG